MTDAAFPLDGIRVVDIAGLIAGPFLRHDAAAVVEVEHPTADDVCGLGWRSDGEGPAVEASDDDVIHRFPAA